MRIVFLFSFFSTIAAADCGVSGSLQERIASCNQATKNLKQVYQKQGVEAWLNGSDSSVYLAGAGDSFAMNWNQSLVFCENLAKSHDFAGISEGVWQIPSLNDFPARSLMEGFREMRYSDYREVRFWMAERYKHPSGQIWAAYYSNQQNFGKWFADAGDLIYRAVCVTKVKL